MYPNPENTQTANYNPIIQLSPFFDFGTIWNNSDSETKIIKKTLSSVGLGLCFLVVTTLTLELIGVFPELS
jgi:hemolysin activation/secretion protein